MLLLSEVLCSVLSFCNAYVSCACIFLLNLNSALHHIKWLCVWTIARALQFLRTYIFFSLSQPPQGITFHLKFFVCQFLNHALLSNKDCITGVREAVLLKGWGYLKVTEGYEASFCIFYCNGAVSLRGVQRYI